MGVDGPNNPDLTYSTVGLHGSQILIMDQVLERDCGSIGTFPSSNPVFTDTKPQHIKCGKTDMN